MDAVDYLKTRSRMCRKYANCRNCPLWDCHYGCSEKMRKPEDAVKVVAEWAEKHKPKTRQNVILERFPYAKIDDDGIIDICPSYLDRNSCDGYDTGIGCVNCRKLYWSQEVPDDE